MTFETLNVLVPASRSRQVEFGCVVVGNGAVGTALGGPANTTAEHQVGIAVELLAVGCECCCISDVWGCQVGAGVHSVDVVSAVACCIGTGADENLLRIKM